MVVVLPVESGLGYQVGASQIYKFRREVTRSFSTKIKPHLLSQGVRMSQ